jgi:hypothetical protein
MLERAENNKRRSVSEKRKRDAREKIELGGLIVKAGLRTADRAVLLGAMIELEKKSSSQREWSRLRAIGREAFIRDTEKARSGRAPDQPDDGNSLASSRT